MRRPHVFERSVPRAKREAHRQPADPALTGRLIAGQLGHMIDRAAADGLSDLANLLERARVEAERLAAGL